MYTWFFICVLGTIATVPLHFLSVEHLKLQERYGKERGTRIGEICGLISGWGFFAFWTGIWISPQPRFTISLFSDTRILVPAGDFSIPILHVIAAIAFLLPGAWFGIRGVEETTVRVAETHRAEKVVTTGVYSIVRHPQYLGGLLAHVGISILLSSWYSSLSTPLMVLLIYFISRKEERELTKEYGKEYEDYKRNVPMFMPRLRSEK